MLFRSKDGTIEIARQWGARVINHDWPGFAAQKNVAAQQARHEWILSVDADERVSPRLRESLIAAMKSPNHDAFEMARLSSFLGRWIHHSGWYPDRKTRLYRKSRARWDEAQIHERVVVDGSVGRLEGDLIHYPYRDLAHNVETLNKYSTLYAESKAVRGRRVRWYNLVLEPPLIFLKIYFIRAGFLDGWPGWVIAANTAMNVFIKHAKRYELQRSNPTGRLESTG